MTLSQTIIRLASVLAGGAILVTLGWALLAVGSCTANVGDNVNWCGLGWVVGGVLCAAIGLAWLAVVAVVAIAAWIARHLDR